MSTANSSQGGLTRRSFLKTAGAAAGAVGLAGAAGMTSTSGWLAPAQAHAEPEERIAYTFHYRHCQCNCHLKCTVRDGRLALIEPNDWPDKRNETICVKGISELQHTYSLERLQTPLKRVGERGQGEFVEISWEEALDTIADEVKRIQEKYGKDAICTMLSVDSLSVNLNRLLGSQEKPHSGIDIGLGNGFSPALAEPSNQGSASNEFRDWKNAKTILNVGCNSLETCMVTARYFFDAKDAGAEIITIDPNFSTTAANSSRWIPIEPGTDAALYSGMMSIILDNGWYDEDYLIANTNLPFLVKTSDGSLLRDHEATKGEDPASNPFKVIDQKTGEVRSYNADGISAQLEGTVVIEGEQYTTAFALLKQKMAECPAKWAAEKTGIPEETIYEITEKYACKGPSILSFGFGGADKFANADVSGHAAVTLATLVGSFGTGIPGRGAGAYVKAYHNGHASGSFPAWPLPSECKTSAAPKDSVDMRDENSRIHMIWLQDGAFQQRTANQNRTNEWAKTLDFIVAQEIWHTPSVDWADIVLPVCSHFECEEDIGMLRSFRGHVLLQEKVLDPLFNSHSDFWIENELAKRLGYGDDVPQSTEELARWQLDNPKDKALEGISLDDLIANNGIVPMNNQPEIYQSYGNQTYKTPSGKIEVYYENLADCGQAIPVYEEPNEAYASNPARNDYPLQFFQRRTRYHLHQNLVDSTWIQQFYSPRVEMNPVDAESRGLAAGDVVEVFNGRGSFKCPCLVSESIRPGTIAMVEGVWDKYMDEGSLQNVTNDYANPRGQKLKNGRVIPYNDTLVEVTKA
ncbi:molybdopterin-dependent oxidoreductase [Adlercreutzia sp. ZJ242]|uniref:molybdopterin-dependent oxidoreductase n=1 Tax=Adlercreutzia sp. ZJ242 TaxID=2709409 RepID=UPI0013ED36D6|nr:molybdopterin-dependent oxidoreductase [Adlercreutzia sp. ZJ242]